MNVRDLQDGAPGGWVAADAFRVDNKGSVWVDLDAPVVEDDDDSEADLLQIRRNRELQADESGLKLGAEHVIEVPAERLAGLTFARVDTPNPNKWGRVTLWKPWSFSWALKTLPARR